MKSITWRTLVFLNVLVLGMTLWSTPTTARQADHASGLTNRSRQTASPAAIPKITNVSRSNTPNGLAGYFSPDEPVTLYSSNSSFGSTQGRVVLGARIRYQDNSATYAQKVNSWTSSEISVTISTGPFKHGNKVFIFVIADGTPSLGFPVYIQFCQPTITSLHGKQLDQGSPVTIYGSCFGHRPDFHEDANKLAYMWSNFNDDHNIATNPYRPWADFTFCGQIWSNQSPRTTLPGDGFFRRTNCSETGDIQTTIGRRKRYYYSMWVRPQVSYTDSRGQVKFFRQWSSTPTPAPTPTGSGITSQVNVSGQPLSGGENWYPANENNSWTFHFEHHDPEVINACESYDSKIPVNSNQWVFFEMFLQRATGPDARDGEMWFKINNRLAFDWYKNFTIDIPQGCNRTDNYGEFQDTGQYDSFLQAGASFTEHWTASSYVDSDDIYFDASQARVMVGNASTFRASTGFEMQLPVAWTGGAIQVRLNRGAFSSLEGKWLYVVDNFGFVNSRGFPIHLSPD